MIHILKYIIGAPGKGLIYENKVTFRLLDIHMLIGQVLLSIKDPFLGIVYLLRVI